ncbi:bifunctional DNA primase/polymerase [Williamsia herbipolensis]|uniref:Bifunctional DNA primase/polymerase n=1 Tax=Williamsia herbipolensis TaxID=1603258 RepID=A0AAU4K4R2_9NOCA|nr:bifunctional DNA primase/polymerase [Williamsia herbipolensis]
MDTDFLSAAVCYLDAGWFSILALPQGKKYPPPTGFTGHDAPDASFPDLTAWAEDNPEQNLALRMPENVIGIDVDHYNGKQGGDTISDAEQRWGALPPTWRTTSRDDEHSGIRFYRVAPGTHLKDRLGDAVEIIQRSHRYAMAWPSVHPSGGTYAWIGPDGQNTIPNVDDLPPLPIEWERGLEVTAPRLVADASQLDGIDFATTGPMSPSVDGRLREAIADLSTPGGRHDTTRNHVLRLMSLSAEGHTGVREALTRLGKAFVIAVADRADADSAQHEYAAMVNHPRGKALIAANLARPQENSIWDATPYLAQIRDAAHSRMLSPAVVLGVVLAYRLGEVPPNVVIPAIIGAPASLNMYSALWGPSGGGKTAALAVGKELISSTHWTAPPGSGEKIPGLFVAPDKEAENGVRWLRRNAVCAYDEITSLAGMANRSGSTLVGTLLSAWSGSAIGAQHQDTTRTHPVPDHSYRLCLSVGVQPRNAGVLMNHQGSGLPQRFLWLNSIDPTLGSLDYTPNASITPLHLSDVANWGDALGPRRDVRVCDSAYRAVWATKSAYHRGEVDGTDSHRLLLQLKVAAGLSILSPGIDEPEITEDVWALAGRVLTELHDPCIALASSEGSRQAKAAARSAGEMDAEREHAAEHAKVEKAANRLRKRMGGGGMTVRDVDRVFNAREKRDEIHRLAVDHLIGGGEWIELDGRYRSA